MIPDLKLVVLLLVSLGVYALIVYNRLIKLWNLIENAWSNIDTELKRRYDLIPNLVNAVKGYAAYEQGVLERVMDMRAQAIASTGSPASQARDENEMVRTLRQLLMLVEGYPHLKASQHFLALQYELADTEDRIQASRRFYNGNVKDFNNVVGQFPSNLFARLFRFQPAEYFEIENVLERQAVPVRF